MDPAFNGLGMGLANMAELSKAVRRSISAEYFTGEKGKAGRQTATLADIEGLGAIQHIWITFF